MNIQLQICGLILLTVLLCITIGEKSLDLSSRRLFLRTMIVSMTTLVMDILSVVAITLAAQGDFPQLPTLIICKLYLILLVSQGYAGFLYVAGEFFADGTHARLRRLYLILFLTGCVAIAVLPIDYYCKGRVVYSFGPSTSATYALAFLLLISTTLVAFSIKDATSRRRRRCICIWQGGWVCAALLQFLRADLLVVGFAAAFGLVIVYAELENPHEGIDRMTGLFTSNAMYVYMRDQIRKRRTFSLMYIDADYGAGDYDYELQKTAMMRIANFLDEERRTHVFYLSDSSFAMIYENAEQMRMSYQRATEQLGKAVGLPVNFTYTLIPDSGVFQNVDELQQFQHYNERTLQVRETRLVGESEAEEMREHFRIRDEISWALENHMVEVFYQPIYNVEKKKFTSAEALARIRRGDGSLVMPGKFIPIAEEYGLIIPLGIEVFRQVCEFLSSGKPQKLGLDYIEVNLSMAQFDDVNPASFVQKIMSRYEVDPTEINLEITETADAIRRQAIQKNMETLIRTGVRFSLDDFGTGRSNLDYFVSMPVSIVKFDYKFTNWYFENKKARSVIRGTVDIIRQMNLPIVAEGVETEKQLIAMEKLGIAFIQGFYFSKPLPRDEFLKFLAARCD